MKRQNEGVFMPKNKSLLLILFLLVFTNACRQTVSETKAVSNPADSAATSKDYAVKVKIKTPDENTVVEVKFDGSNTKLEYAGKVLRGDMKDAEKRKYSFEGGNQIAEVKAKDADGFKVRTTDGKLLWKVKIAPEKIKISDNEENQNAYELVKREDGAKIEQNENKLGEVKFYRDRQKIKVKDAADKEIFDGNTDKYSVSYGVLLLDKIPEEMRYIIIAELLARSL
jgi:hypothetical protein